MFQAPLEMNLDVALETVVEGEVRSRGRGRGVVHLRAPAQLPTYCY